MSRKIPLERTIGGAYGFLLSDLVSILGIAWFPLLLFGGLSAAAIWFGALAHPLPPLKIEPGNPDIAFAVALARIMIPVFICAVLLAVMLTTCLTSRALGRMEGTTYFYFNLGAPFWRMFAAFFIAGFILVVLRVLLHAVGVVWTHTVAPALPLGIAVIATVLGVLALAALFIYVAVRLLFLLPAVVIAEERIGVGRAWHFGGGNFWRALLSILAALLPAFIVFCVLNVALFIGTLRGFPMPPFAGQEHPVPREVIAYVNQAVPIVLNFLKTNWLALLALQAAYLVVRTALFAGASANAYLGVAPEEEAQAGERTG
jgi:hypothetical protein